jgi:hypothetical protein
MKRTLTAFTAIVFATAIALPAFAQVGAGVAGNASVGTETAHAGANSDVANSDAERAEPASPTDSSPAAARRHLHRSENSPTIRSNGSKRGTGTSPENGISVNGLNGNAGQPVSPGTDNSPTGGY